jgi:hypothetical protein
MEGRSCERQSQQREQKRERDTKGCGCKSQSAKGEKRETKRKDRPFIAGKQVKRGGGASDIRRTIW